MSKNEIPLRKRIDSIRFRKLQERIQNENLIEKLLEAAMDPNIIALINSLQETQSRTEKNLFTERQRLIKQSKGLVKIIQKEKKSTFFS